MISNVRIVGTDNFGMGGETPGRDDFWVLWPMPKEDADAIVKILNKQGGDNAPHFFKTVPFDYKLRKFEP